MKVDKSWMAFILVHEAIHSLKITKKSGMMMKLDLTKAFDSLSWKYMRGIMGAFGFGREWIEWIKNMVTTT